METASTRVAAGAAAAPRLRALAELPAPRGWPLVGNLLQFDLPRLHAQLEDWVERHGTLFRLRVLRRDALVVARPDLITPLLRDRPEGWRRMRNMQSVIREMGSHGLFSAEGDDWRRQRRLVMGAFDPGHLKRYFPSLVRVTERLRQRLDCAATGGEKLDLQTLLMRFTVDVTAGLAFGADVNTLEQPHNALQDHLDKVFPMLYRRMNTPIAYWRYLRLPSDRAFDRHLAKVHEAVRGFIQAARERMGADPGLRQRPGNLLEALIAAADDEGIGLSEQEIVGNVLTVLLAGEDTTANTLGWALHFLHSHRDVWQTLVAEVDAALDGDDLPRRFDLARGFPFLEACVNEAMRLRPVAPLFLFEANHDTQLGDVAMPRDTMVFCVMRKGATDTAVSADAAQFRPARWQAAADGADPASRVLTKASMPFGAGPRLCPGRYLALLEMKMVLATIARNFELLEVATDDGSPPQEKLAFTMFPVGLQMRLAVRSRR